MRIAAPFLALAVASCASVQLPADENATLDPIAFFTGTSHGQGELRIVFTDDPRKLAVRSVGRPDGSGGLALDQTIAEEGKPARTRRWIMRRAGPALYSGTLTDASGPVSIRVEGPRAFIDYSTPDGLTIRQQLALQEGGRTLLNHMTLHKYGVRVARVRETIRKGG